MFRAADNTPSEAPAFSVNVLSRAALSAPPWLVSMAVHLGLLVALAIARGGTDNISAGLVRLVEGPRRAAGRPTREVASPYSTEP